jgi:prepilin-type N-terminal cleavage/methylation domain-containing protein
MTRGLRHRARGGFTLVELLVAMAVIILLASIALVVVPGVLDQDRTTDGASLTRQYLMIAKARAARDNLPRGVRLITGLDPTNPAKSNLFWATEMQYTEATPVVVPNPNVLGGPADPAVRFTYTVVGTQNPPAGTLPGTVAGNPARRCEILNLTSDFAVQVVPGAVIALPLLGTWHQVTTATGAQAQVAPLDTTRFTVTVTLDHYPDAALGAAGTTQQNTAALPVYQTYHFGLYGPPRPLLGEPTLQLPRNICVDLNVSNLRGGLEYDIVFAPSGQVLMTNVEQIHLWVRDYTKTPSMVPINPNPLTYNPDAFRQGGEQQLVSIKTRSGALGVFPVLWPTNMSNGTYANNQDPYWFARQGATGQ